MTSDTELDDDVRRLAKSAYLATVVTLMPDGRPQALPLWVDTDGTHLLVNTEPDRQRSRNVARDARVAVLLLSTDNPYDWAEVRGRVVGQIDGQPARDHLDELSRRYTGRDFGMPVGPQGRVILKIAAERVNSPRRMGLDPARPDEG